MTVIKRKDMDWKEYLSELATQPGKLSDISKTEFSGFLLKRDQIQWDAKFIFTEIFWNKEVEMANLISNLLIAESPDTIFDFLKLLKETIINNYHDEMIELLEEEKTNQSKDKTN